jgi:uncharacterized MnhB-related membrane protein
MSLDLVTISLVGAISTFLLAKRNRFDAIKASSSLSIIAYCLFYFLNLKPDIYGLVFFGSTFVGMSAPKRFGLYSQIVSAVLFALMFEYLVPLINGYGGALGLSAFLSVCICHIGITLGAPRSKK